MSQYVIASFARFTLYNTVPLCFLCTEKFLCHLLTKISQREKYVIFSCSYNYVNSNSSINCMTFIFATKFFFSNDCLRLLEVTQMKRESLLLNGNKYQAEVKICSPSPAMVTSQNAWVKRVDGSFI